MFDPMLDCFYRFDGLTLQPGNKTAGFTVQVRTDALRSFRFPVTDDALDLLMRDIEQRVANSGLLPADALGYLRILFEPGSAVPRAFVVDPMFGGSVGADPDELPRVLAADDSEEQWPLVAYTPHNLDQPAQALVLMVMVVAWAEWAGVQRALNERGAGHG